MSFIIHNYPKAKQKQYLLSLIIKLAYTKLLSQIFNFIILFKYHGLEFISKNVILLKKIFI